jgi:drug/metabolite transporter (DMT)-like permease
MTKAFQNGEVNTVAPIKYSEIVFTLSFGVYWFGEVYSLTSLIGIALVIMSLTLSVLYKAKKVKE